MAVIVRDSELEQKLDAERQRKFGERGSLARVLRDIARDYFLKRDIRNPPRPVTRREKQVA